MRLLAVIPARGGSKGVPRKNVRALAGKPLIAWTIEAALAASDLFARIFVSTDDPEIAAAARDHGAEVPRLRPRELGQDLTPMLPVLQHALSVSEEELRVQFDWVMLLQPTAPFRTGEDIRAAVRLAREGSCDSVISVVQVFAEHPILMKRIQDGQLLPYCIAEREGTRRQDYSPPAYMRNGAIYLTRRDIVMERNSIWGSVIRPYVMPEDRSPSIDSEIDFLLCDLLMNKRLGRSPT
jgi:CMP-N-acetylneuraminic acid synthetase